MRPGETYLKKTTTTFIGNMDKDAIFVFHYFWSKKIAFLAVNKGKKHSEIDMDIDRFEILE